MKTKTHTLEDIKKIISKLDKEYGNDFSNLPIRVNKRMTSTIAYASIRVKSKNHKVIEIIPINFTFSYHFLNAFLTKEQFEDIVIHEYLHLHTNKKYNDDCNHDYRYKAECKRIGKEYLSKTTCDMEVTTAFIDAIERYRNNKIAENNNYEVIITNL